MEGIVNDGSARGFLMKCVSKGSVFFRFSLTARACMGQWMTIETIPLQLNLQQQRHAEAQSWRQSLISRGVLCLNLISSPSAGKTSLLQAMARHWAVSLQTGSLQTGSLQTGSLRMGSLRMGVLVGDIATDRDAQRLAPLVPVTDGLCPRSQRGGLCAGACGSCDHDH